jgi:ribosomal protein S1
MTEEKQELEQTTELTASEETAPAEEAVQSAAEVEAAAPEVEAETAAAPTIEEPVSDVHYSELYKGLSRGDLVDGVVVHIDKEGVLVDVGQKSEGIIRPGELSARHVESPEEIVSVGDTIKVMVVEYEDKEGNLILSKKRADFEKAWDRVQEAHEKGTVITAMVTDRVKGGLQVDLGIRGFVPGSHVGSGKVMNLDRFVGQSIPLRVIEIDRERRKVVLSHRMAVEEQRSKQRDTTMANLAEGQEREGVVRRITDYGAFVDLGGVDGLLHISEMSWTRIKHPSDMVKVGQKITIMVLKLDSQKERISLGLRQILPDPWSEVEGKYKPGDIVQGSVSRLVPFGAFVQLEGGIEGIIPNTEISHKRVKRPEDVVSVGEPVEVKVLDVRAEERRMTLSLRALQERPEPEPVRERERDRERDNYQSASSGFSGRMTLGDLVGDKLQGLVSSVKEEKEEAPAPKPKSARKSKAAEAAAAEAEIAAEEEASAPEAEEVVAAPEAEAPAVEETVEAVEAAETPAEESGEESS